MVAQFTTSKQPVTLIGSKFDSEQEEQIVVDAILNESLSFNAQITDYGVEGQVSATDWAIIQPIVFSMSIVITDDPAEIPATQSEGLTVVTTRTRAPRTRLLQLPQFSNQRRIEPEVTRIAQIKDIITRWHRERYLVTINALRDTFSNFIIESINTSIIAGQGNIQIFDLTFKEVKIVQSSTISLDIKPFETRLKPKQKKKTKKPVPVEEEEVITITEQGGLLGGV